MQTQSKDKINLHFIYKIVNSDLQRSHFGAYHFVWSSEWICVDFRFCTKAVNGEAHCFKHRGDLHFKYLFKYEVVAILLIFKSDGITVKQANLMMTILIFCTSLSTLGNILNLKLQN